MIVEVLDWKAFFEEIMSSSLNELFTYVSLYSVLEYMNYPGPYNVFILLSWCMDSVLRHICEAPTTKIHSV